MRNTAFTFLAFLLTTYFSFSQESETPVFKEPVKEFPRDSIVSDPEQKAEFNGGRSEMNKFLAKNITYPRGAIKANLQGKCYVRMVVEKDGTISDVKVLRGVPNCSECDAEAIRVIQAMPKMVPAKHSGETVRSHFNLPINFSLNK